MDQVTCNVYKVYGADRREGTANAQERTGVSPSMEGRWRRPHDRNCWASQLNSRPVGIDA